MERKNKISNNQLKALIVSTIIGVGVLSVPSDTAKFMNNGGWISILLGGFLTIPIILIMNSLARMYPGKTYFEFGREIVPNFIFKIISIIFLIYFVILLAFVVRILGEVIKAFLLETTPIEIIIITMLLVTAYIGRCDIDVIGRVALIIYPIIIITTIGVIVFSIPKMDFSNILPMSGIKLKSLLISLPSTFFSYVGFEVILIAMGRVEKPEKSLKYSIFAVICVTCIYIIMFFMTLAQFGIHELRRQIWPSLVLIREIDFPGFFIENIDGIVMAVWVVVIFGTMGPFLYSSGIVLSSIFNTKKHEYFIIALIPIIYILSLIPQNLRDTYRYINIVVYIVGTMSIVAFPIILYIVAKVKKRR